MAHRTIATENGQIDVELTPEELAQLEIDRQQALADRAVNIKRSIKELASRKILTIADEVKQRNMLAQAIELIATQPQDLSIKLNALQVTWDKIKAIRAASNTIEESFDNAEDKINFDIEAGWPE